MKIVVVTSLLFATAAFAAGLKGTPQQIQQELTTIENEVLHANETCDRKVFERVEAEEFIFVDSRGGITTRQEDLDGMKDCKPKELRPELADIRVQVHGETAIFNAKLTETVHKADGTTASGTFRFTDVFVWRDGRWQMVLGQSTRIPAK